MIGHTVLRDPPGYCFLFLQFHLTTLPYKLNIYSSNVRLCKSSFAWMFDPVYDNRLLLSASMVCCQTDKKCVPNRFFCFRDPRRVGLRLRFIVVAETEPKRALRVAQAHAGGDRFAYFDFKS